jgi:hypothetical protein
MIDCDVILHASPFLQVTTAKAKEDSFQSQLIGGDTFDKELTYNCRFNSSELNLTSEGLLLGVSLHFRVKVTSSSPRQLGSCVHNTSTHLKRGPVVFCRWPRMPGDLERRSKQTDKVKAPGSAWEEAVSRRCHIGCQPKVATPALPRGSVSLEHCRMMS